MMTCCYWFLLVWFYPIKWVVLQLLRLSDYLLRCLIGSNAGNTTVIDAAGVDKLTLGWRLQDLDFEVQTNTLVNKASGQRVTIEGFDLAQGAPSCPIEVFELTNELGEVVQLSAAELFDRTFELTGTPLDDVIEGKALLQSGTHSFKTTPKSIAACARVYWARRRFDTQNKHKKAKKQGIQCRTGLQSTQNRPYTAQKG